MPAGYLSPKYLIATVTYAPPNLASTVSYGNSQETGSTTSFTGSLSSSSTLTTDTSQGIGFNYGWHHGNFGVGVSTTDTSTSQSTEAETSTNTFTTDIKQINSYTLAGYPIPWNGWATSGFNPDDWDTPWLWLDAVLPFEAPTDSTAVWFGYGYDACDPADGNELTFVYDGWLWNNGQGDAGFPSQMPSSLRPPNGDLGRHWATPSGAATLISQGLIPNDCAGQTFASGDSAGLNPSVDYLSIIKADPLDYNFPNYRLDNYGGNTSGDGRYTRSSAFVDPSTLQIVTTQTDIPFVPCPSPGCKPEPISSGVTYTQASQEGSTSSYSDTETTGMDSAFTGSIFAVNIGGDLKQSYSVTTGYSTNQTTTDTNSNFGNFSLVPPPCNPNPNATSCENYAGPGEFDVYQDNIFGTFMFWPSDQQ